MNTHRTHSATTSIARALAALLVVALMAPAPASALTCPRDDFATQVERSQTVLIGEVAEVLPNGQFKVTVVKTLKGTPPGGAEATEFTVTTDRFTTMPEGTKKGSLILFLLPDGTPAWKCYMPILIR